MRALLCGLLFLVLSTALAQDGIRADEPKPGAAQEVLISLADTPKAMAAQIKAGSTVDIIVEEASSTASKTVFYSRQVTVVVDDTRKKDGHTVTVNLTKAQAQALDILKPVSKITVELHKEATKPDTGKVKKPTATEEPMPDTINLQAAKNHCDMGHAYSRTKEYKKAINEFTEAIRLDPDNSYYIKNRGLAYRASGDLNRAIADFTEAIRIKPDYAAALVDRGIAYAAKKDFEHAIVDYTKAIEVHPGYALAYEQRSKAYNNKGDRAAAQADLEEAKRLEKKTTSPVTDDPPLASQAKPVGWEKVGDKVPTSSKQLATKDETHDDPAITSAGDLAFTLEDLAKVLGKPDEKSDDHLLYRNKLKAVRNKNGINILFSLDNEGLFFAAGLFTSKVFTKSEGEQVINFLDEIDKVKEIGRFQVKVSNATIPRGWCQVSFFPRMSNGQVPNRTKPIDSGIPPTKVDDPRRLPWEKSGKLGGGPLEELGWNTKECLLCQCERTVEERKNYSDGRGFGFCASCGKKADAFSVARKQNTNGLPIDDATSKLVRAYLESIQKYLPKEWRDTEKGRGLSLILIGCFGHWDHQRWEGMWQDAITSGALSKSEIIRPEKKDRPK